MASASREAVAMAMWDRVLLTVPLLGRQSPSTGEETEAQRRCSLSQVPAECPAELGVTPGCGRAPEAVPRPPPVLTSPASASTSQSLGQPDPLC